jgi:glycosyltransferase involved in cell wall biosynthesis
MLRPTLPMAKTIALSINSSWNILNFRAGLIEALKADGHRVVALSPADGYHRRFEAVGIEHVPIEIDSAGLSPLRDLRLLLDYRRELKRIGADVFLGYTAKPNIYGALAAQSLGIAVINNISGLGTAFIQTGLLTRIVSSLYRIALRRSATIFFQNPEDLDLFVSLKLVSRDRARLLPGSGIDLQRFAPSAEPRPPGPLSFLLVGRLLWQKGVREYVEAARLVRREVPDARFNLLGFLDVANRSAVSRPEVDAWVTEGLIDYLGEADDVRPHIAAADCVVLPSYREGLPRTLLEGAAMGKPLIATDVPGCRQVVEPGINGLLCKAADAASLAEAMLALARLSQEEREAMGAAGRRKAERDYSERVAIDRYRQAVAEALNRR